MIINEAIEIYNRCHESGKAHSHGEVCFNCPLCRWPESAGDNEKPDICDEINKLYGLLAVMRSHLVPNKERRNEAGKHH